MNAPDNSNPINSLLQEVVVLRAETAKEVEAAQAQKGQPKEGWRCRSIYRWRASAIEMWSGPSSHGENDPAACQLKQDGAEIAFLDIGTGSTALGRRTGTVLGELVSFEQERRKILPPRSIEIRLAVKQPLQLSRSWKSTQLTRADGIVVATFKNGRLRINNHASHAEGVTAVLIHASGILNYLGSPIRLKRSEPT